MIDTHTHILPQMDDGSRSVEQSIAMLREEKNNGIDTVVLTPHFYAFQNNPQTFLKRRERSWDMLQAQLTEDLPRILLGAEVQYFEGISCVEELPGLCIEGTNLLMLEMPESRWSERMVHDVLDLHDERNLTVVLAHIERYLKLQPKALWDDLLEGGVLMQASAAFFQNWTTRRMAHRMLQQGRIHLLGSDCHNMDRRPPNLKTWMAYDRWLFAEGLIHNCGR